MKINLIPEEYLTLSQKEIVERITNARKLLGREIVILGHNYQREDVLGFADFTGDSYKLCQLAMRQSAKYIIFCGVHFMAESADILSRPEQVVILPDLKAGCSMADMANISGVERAWKEICSVSDNYLPITYINSSADIKAFCGKNDGYVCTSSNAVDMFDYGLSNGKRVIFFPDEHLGRYAGLKLGLKEDEMIVWDPSKVFGGN
ncbi:MAG: quinolinate synthase NadA, partial [Nanoarchaeota archaeon]